MKRVLLLLGMLLALGQYGHGQQITLNALINEFDCKTKGCVLDFCETYGFCSDGDAFVDNDIQHLFSSCKAVRTDVPEEYQKNKCTFKLRGWPYHFLLETTDDSYANKLLEEAKQLGFTTVHPLSETTSVYSSTQVTGFTITVRQNTRQLPGGKTFTQWAFDLDRK